MKNNFVLSFVVLLFLSSSFLLFKKENSKIKSKVKSHLKPPDEYYLNRNYPNIGEGNKAFKKAIDKAYFLKNKYRNSSTPWTIEGPTNIGGRITNISLDPTNSQIIYIGTPAAGVFKSINGGISWTHIFKDEKSLAIGSIAIDPTNPQTIFLGTGDNALSSFNFNGSGIYKSTDGGNTWISSGLTDVGVINKLIINPQNPQIIYAGTVGNIYSTDANRGLYKSIDGGSSWNQILFLGNNAGIGDMQMNLSKPDTLFVTGRFRHRTNAVSIVNGTETKIYRTYNGGNTWDTVTNGLPTGKNCKITLAMSQTNPSLIYASYCDTTMNYGGLYKTTNSGNSWSFVSLDPSLNMGGFGWYFGEIKLDPNNDNTIYWMGVDFFKSTNGGLTWTMNAPAWYQNVVHADKHDLEFINSNTFLLATDGGLYKATNGGGTISSNWNYISNIPIIQFYRVGYNKFDSTNYYGGAQDNGTQVGSFAGGLGNWVRYFSGDGFQPAFDNQDELIYYAEVQNGDIYCTSDGGSNWDPITQSISTSERCNWNTPYVMGKYSPNTMYTGSYRVYKNTYSLVDNWTPISGDLTNGTMNQNHTISALDNSNLSAGLLYAGTSDGRVWVTKNDGTTWSQINAGLPNKYVSSVKASPNSLSAAFLSYWGYRDNDTTAYIYYTNDYGVSWTSIASASLPNFAINDIWILPDGKDSSILIANDGGVYATQNRGANWERVGSNMPFIPVNDIEYNVALKKIFVGTFAMSIQSIPLDSIFTKKAITIGVKNTELKNTKIYPNPCTNYFMCEPNFANSYSVLIFNSLGQLVFSQKNLTGNNRIETNSFHKGVYYVCIESNGKKEIQIITKSE